MVTRIEMKKWGKPGLIVLVRGRPEEVVLAVCKGLPITGVITLDNHCETGLDCSNRCSAIQAS